MGTTRIEVQKYGFIFTRPSKNGKNLHLSHPPHIPTPMFVSFESISMHYELNIMFCIPLYMTIRHRTTSDDRIASIWVV